MRTFTQILKSFFLAAAVVVPQQALMAAGPAPVNLRSLPNFVFLAGSEITTAGQAYAITGNLGLSPAAGSYYANVTQADITGIIYEVSAGGPSGAVVDPTLLTTATGDFTTAYNDAAGRISTPTAPVIQDPGSSGNIGGLVLAPGLYRFTTSPANISGSAVTLMGTGGSNDVWIFQCAAGITVNESVILAGGAQAGNIFWQVGTTAVIGTGVAFQGTILAHAAITMASTSTLVGRALAGTAVTFDGSSATLPTPLNSSLVPGSLLVTIAPSAAASAGAQWQVDGGADQSSGTILSNVSSGNYTVSFTSISGWSTPSNQIVTVSLGSTTIANGQYVPTLTPSNGLILLTNGDGIILHAPWPAELAVGNNYMVTAVANPTNIFSNWVGGTTQPFAVLSTSARYTFAMAPNLVLQANFVANPFIPATGIYDGLFYTTNGITEQTSGMLRRLTVGAKGTYSGGLLINGALHNISGSFDLSGQATNHIPRVAINQDLTVEMELDWTVSPPQVTGTVFGTNDGVPWAATLLANLATNNIPAAAYTMLLPPDTNNAPPDSSPSGDSYALITNDANSVAITGALADGTAFSQTAPISQNGYVPIYISLYGSRGLLLGWINLDLTNTAGVSLTWVHPERTSGSYQHGFTNVIYTNQILLSPWTNPPLNLALITNLSLLDSINSTNTLTNIGVNVSGSGKVTGPAVSGTINPKTGFLKLTIGSGAAKTIGYGAILPNATNGGGYYLTATNAQALKMAP